jgi:hypothetical protein
MALSHESFPIAIDTTSQCLKQTLLQNNPNPLEQCFENIVDLLQEKELDYETIKELKLNEKQIDFSSYEKTITKYKELLQKEQLTLKIKIINLQSQLKATNTNPNQTQIINPNSTRITDIINEQGGFPKVLFGWWISAIAISMGAPFWFDLLGRVMNVRNAGKPSSSQPSNSSSNSGN